MIKFRPVATAGIAAAPMRERPDETANPTARRGRKATGPSRSAGLPNQGTVLLRRVFRMSARLLALVVTFAVLGPVTHALAGGFHARPAWAGEPQLEITGSAPDLVPGRPVTVEVRISSPSRSAAAVRVMRLTAQVSDASPACTAGNVSISSYRWTAAGPTYSASPGAGVVVPLTMTLLDTATNQDACQGALFPIRFRVESASV